MEAPVHLSSLPQAPTGAPGFLRYAQQPNRRAGARSASIRAEKVTTSGCNDEEDKPRKASKARGHSEESELRLILGI